ncbi:GNAT family N-acetyltransferase [Halococcus agarilyticus]|uniref:GNAT family N-acetyltransferase n=1 Tax=Halococcus agarilyticus TaxID=1232219 RepID=UPI000677F43B|nr:GNAT family N-acetyltransferase [Halococcus agarilyticus]
MNIERLDLAAWDDGLPKTGFEPFHTASALSVLDRHAPGDLLLLGGYRGEQLVGMLPVFVRNAGRARVLSSPPPGMSVPHLGPIVMPTSPKQRKREKVTREFTEGVLDALGVDAPTTLCRFLCHTDYPDPRPYRWAGLSVEPSFTYRLQVGDRAPEDIMGSFSRSLRREIRSGEDLDVEIGTEEIDGAETVFRETQARYAEQNEGFGPTWPYVRDVVADLDERSRVYVARDPDGEYLGGVITLFSNDAAYYWLGGARTTHDGVSINSLLHWRIIRDVAEDPPIESVTEYDLVGANTERLCRYKSKFGADLAPYYVIESGGPAMDAAKGAYRMVNQAVDRLGL